ncbi:MAG: hypothetical protein ABIV50_12735 [Opitutus sp.]
MSGRPRQVETGEPQFGGDVLRYRLRTNILALNAAVEAARAG